MVYSLYRSLAVKRPAPVRRAPLERFAARSAAARGASRQNPRAERCPHARGVYHRPRVSGPHGPARRAHCGGAATTGEEAMDQWLRHGLAEGEEEQGQGRPPPQAACGRASWVEKWQAATGVVRGAAPDENYRGVGAGPVSYTVDLVPQSVWGQNSGPRSSQIAQHSVALAAVRGPFPSAYNYENKQDKRSVTAIFGSDKSSRLPHEGSAPVVRRVKRGTSLEGLEVQDVRHTASE